MSTESTGLIGKYTLLDTAICIFKCLSYDLLDVDGATMNQNQALDIYHTEEDAGKGGGSGEGTEREREEEETMGPQANLLGGAPKMSQI